MREILFRGMLSSDNGNKTKGEWVYGHYMVLMDGKRGIPHIYGQGEVVAGTIGQYTGLTDKNGKQIYEGDIVNVQYETEYVGLKPKPSYMGVVEFKDGAFGIYESGKGTQFFFQHGLIKTVIGNIHDNPELLKGDDTDA